MGEGWILFFVWYIRDAAATLSCISILLPRCTNFFCMVLEEVQAAQAHPPLHIDS